MPGPPRFPAIFAILLALPTPTPAIDEPATVAEATRFLDLASFPLFPGAESNNPRRLAHLTYSARANLQDAYSFQKQTLEKLGWNEAPGGYQSDQACSGSFVKGGYTLSVSVTPSYATDAAGQVDIILSNHGNVDVTRLPVPPGSKPLYSFPTVAAYVTDTPVPDTARDLATRLTSQGWQPYGQAGDSHYFKNNAVKLSALVSVAPAQDGKTMIQLSSELMSADLPAPPSFLTASYADTTKALSVDVDSTPDALVAFYETALGESGWKPTTDAPSKIDFRDMLIFRNAARDLLFLKTHEVDGKLRAELEHRTSAEFEEELRLAREAEAKRKADAAEQARMAAEKAAQSQLKVAIALPAGARSVDRSSDQVEFQLPPGKAIGAVKTILASLARDGWKSDAKQLDPMAGTITLAKGESAKLVLVYLDLGLDDAQVTLSSFGALLQPPDEK